MQPIFKLRLLLLVPVSTAIILTPIAVNAQEKKVTGKVADENGTPLNGASIVIKGTKIGANTDEAGSFSLTVPNTNSILVISFSGYTSKEVNATNLAAVEKLMPDVKKQALNEVVVTG